MEETGKSCTVRIYHVTYGDGPSHGHAVEIDDGDDVDVALDFAHPHKYEDRRRWAQDLARRVVKEEWPQCYQFVDWDTVEYDEVDPD